MDACMSIAAEPSMKLLSKQREWKKVRCVYDTAKTPLQRLPQSGVLPAQEQQELTQVAQALDPIRLFQQLEQLQQAVFHCAVNCSPFVPSTTPAPIRVFSVEHCTAGNVPAERSAPSYLVQCRDLLRFRTSAHLSKRPSGILPREDVRTQTLLHSTQ